MAALPFRNKAGAFSGKVGTGFPQKMRPLKDFTPRGASSMLSWSNPIAVAQSAASKKQLSQ
jgi:hypothetical protein